MTMREKIESDALISIIGGPYLCPHISIDLRLVANRSSMETDRVKQSKWW